MLVQSLPDGQLKSPPTLLSIVSWVEVNLGNMISDG